MRALTANELLSIWERGHALSLPNRALALLLAACPDVEPDDLMALPVGRRDAEMFELRAQTFGTKLVGLADCPACGERLDLDLNVTDLLAGPFDESSCATDNSADRTWSYEAGRYRVEFRLPNCRDLAAVAKVDDAPAARQILLKACLLAAEQNGESQSLDALPADVVDAVIQRIAELDPQGETYLALTCPVCEHRWKILLDIVSFFWTEIDAWARRTLGEVHELASAYGWREADILAMSATRRQLYLEMVGG